MAIGRCIAFALCLALASFAPAQDRAKAADDGVQISKLDDRLRVEINGKLFTEYHFKDAPVLLSSHRPGRFRRDAEMAIGGR